MLHTRLDDNVKTNITAALNWAQLLFCSKFD